MDVDGINVPDLTDSTIGGPTGDLEVSGVAYVPNGTGSGSNPSFFMIADEYSFGSNDEENDGAIFEYEYNAAGDSLTHVRTIDIDGLDNRLKNRGDPEGIVWLGSTGAGSARLDYFGIVAERIGEMHLFSLSPTDAPSGSTVDLKRVSNTGTTTLTATANAMDKASFTVTVNSTERVREMDVTYDVELPHKQAAAVSVLPTRDFWPAPAGTPAEGYHDKPSSIMVPGDFNRDKVVDIDDIESLIDVMFANEFDPIMDLDGDNSVGADDIQRWIESLYESFLGDANLDGTVNANDLNVLGVNWLQANRNWSGGDFNGDGLTNSADLTAQGLNWLLSSNKH